MSDQVVAQIRDVVSKEHHYKVIMFKCPGCATANDGLHMLPVSGDVPDGRAKWDWDGNLETPTLSPSILTHYTMSGTPFVCHSFLRNGVFEFLSDCTHELAGQNVPMIPMDEWMTK